MRFEATFHVEQDEWTVHQDNKTICIIPKWENADKAYKIAAALEIFDILKANPLPEVKEALAYACEGEGKGNWWAYL